MLRSKMYLSDRANVRVGGRADLDPSPGSGRSINAPMLTPKIRQLALKCGL